MERIKKLYRFIAGIVSEITNNSIGVYAAQASFFVIISVVPFVMLFLSLLNKFLSIDLSVIDGMIKSSVPPSLQEVVLKITDEVFDKSLSVPIISVSAISTLWLASRGIMALYQGLGKVYKAEKRNFFYDRAISFLYTLIFITSLTLTITVFSFGNTIHTALMQYAPFLAYFSNFVLEARTLIFLVFLTLAFSLMYKFLPRKKPHLKFIKQLPGALFSAFGWMIFSYIYSIYIENFSNYSYVYGSLTAVIFLMLWLYFYMYIFLLGAQMNVLVENKYFKTAL